jgi:hypothetical protein
MTIWQVAGGDGSHDYTDVFLKYGVFLVGPGSEGNYFSNKRAYNDQSEVSFRAFIRVHAEEISMGDLLVLKRPAGSDWEIIAVGQVSSDYIYEATFGDVDGWDLQHARKVLWKKPVEKTVLNGLRRGTICRIYQKDVIDKVSNLWETGIACKAEEIPKPATPVEVDELIDSLMNEGLLSGNAEIIAATIWRLRRIAKWYGSHGSDVGEHEIRTFLIVPLMTSLGWAEQKIKIEWNKIDVAIFDKPYCRTSTPSIIIESKRLHFGMRYAPNQAEEYAKKYPACTRFIVSDGIRYKLYIRNDSVWIFNSYMNLLTPTTTHPHDVNIGGAVKFFLSVISKGSL